MICPKCGKPLAEGTTFCGSCGTKIEKIQAGMKGTNVCPKCGNRVGENDAFCDECGFLLNASQAKGTGKFAALMKNKAALIVGAGIAGVVVISTIVLASIQLSKTESSDEVPSKLIYFKDDSMMMIDLSRKKAKPVELTRSFSEDYKRRGIYSDNFLSKDGKYVLYEENYDVDQHTYDLYIAKLPRLTDRKKIDSKVRSHIFLDNNTVFYTKKDSLFLYNGKDTVRFAKDVRYNDYQVDKNQKNILWAENNRGKKIYYIQDIAQKNNAVKIDDDADNFYYNENLTRFFSLKDNNLYSFDREGNRERITKDISQILQFDKKTGMFFYTKNKTEQIPYLEFVYDDTDELSERNKKQLEQEKYTYSSYELYWFDGRNEYLIDENFAYELSAVLGEKGQYCLYKQNPDIDSIKVAWSEMKNDSWRSAVEQTIHEEQKLILSSGDIRIGEYEDIFFCSCLFNEESKKLYLYTFDRDGSDETIWEVSLSGSNAGELNEYDYGENIQLLFANDKGLGYLKDVEGGEGDFYFNREEAEIEVSFAQKIEGSGLAAVSSDYDSSDQDYLLSVWNGKNIIHVSEEVNFAECTKDGTVVLLSNYDYNRKEGDLFYFDGKELRSLDYEVSGFTKRTEDSLIVD